MGAGSDVFAVWGFVIANTVDSQVELNPILLAAMLGTTPERCQTAIDYLTAPDPRSRSKNDDGRRLIREGEFAYRVPNHAAYREIRHEDDRREYNRIKKAEQRARERVNTPVNDSQIKSALSAQADTEAKADTEPSSSAREELLSMVPNRRAWEAEMQMCLQGGRKFAITPEQVEDACREYLGNGASANPNLRYFRTYLERASKGTPASPTDQIAQMKEWAKRKDAEEAARG